MPIEELKFPAYHLARRSGLAVLEFPSYICLRALELHVNVSIEYSSAHELI
jgi:hypothetical protein